MNVSKLSQAKKPPQMKDNPRDSHNPARDYKCARVKDPSGKPKKN